MQSPNTHHSFKEKQSFFAKTWEYICKFQSYEWVILSFIFLTGLCLFLWGLHLHESSPDIGNAIVTFATVITIESISSTINHFVLHRKNLEAIAIEINEKMINLRQDLLNDITPVLEKLNVETSNIYMRAIRDIQKTRSLGILNLEKGLDLVRIIGKIRTTHNDTLLLQRLYFSEVEFRLLRENIVNLIEKNNHTIRILLLAPVEISTIRRRLKYFFDNEEELHNDSLKIHYSLQSQLAKLSEIRKSLPEDKKDNLQVKIHNNLVVASLTAYEDKIIHCPYLHNRTSDEGIHIRVKGIDTQLYKEWNNHFIICWLNAASYDVENGKLTNITYPGQNSTLRKSKTLAECLAN